MSLALVAAWAGVTSVVGVAANVAGNAVSNELGGVMARMARDGIGRFAGFLATPEGDEMVEALRLAQLNALERLIENYAALTWKDSQGRIIPPPEDFIASSRTFTRNKLRRSWKLDLNGEIITPLQHAMNTALTGIEQAPEEAALRLQRLAEKSVLDELVLGFGPRADGSPTALPDTFGHFFYGRCKGHEGWWQLFAAFLSHEITKNEAFRTRLFSAQLLDLHRSGMDQSAIMQNLQGWANWASPILKDIHARTRRIDVKTASIDKTTRATHMVVEQVEAAGRESLAVAQETRSQTRDMHHYLITERAELMHKIKQTATEKKFRKVAIDKFLDDLGQKNVDPNELPSLFDAWAREIIELRQQNTKPSNAAPEIQRLRSQIAVALGDYDLETARDLLVEISNIEFAQVKRRQSRQQEEAAAEIAAREDAARTQVQLGDLETTRLNNYQAASHYAQAEKILPEEDIETRSKYLNYAFLALFTQGERFGSAEALEAAIKTCRALLTLNPEQEHPDAWATTQMNLGSANRVLGEQGAAGRLDDAVDAYTQALRVFTPETAAQQWAETQVNLGNAYMRLGQQRAEGRLDDAVDAFNQALRVFTPETAAQQWATTQMNLGIVYGILGEQGGAGDLRMPSMPINRHSGFSHRKPQL